GGVASLATQVSLTPSILTPAGLAFGKNALLYLPRQSGDVFEPDPATGTIMRTVASIPLATGLATDPLSGDLFVSNVGNIVYRISNFASGPGTVTSYANIFGVDGLAFGPDGTLFAALFFGVGVAKIAVT